MTNIKKVVIFILVLFLILIFKRRRQIENFFDQKYIEQSFTRPDVNHASDLININVEFFYKDTCTISRQFLYGCCKPYNEQDKDANKLQLNNIYSIEGIFDPLGGLIDSNSLYQKDEEGKPYYEIKDEHQNPRWDETHCMDHAGNKLKSCYRKNQGIPDKIIDEKIPFKRSEFYHPGDTCMPIDYFNYTDKDGIRKPGCLLKKNLNGLTKPTFYYIKRFIDYVNSSFDDLLNVDLAELNSWMSEKQGVKKAKNFRNKDELKFHIHFKIISSKDEIKTKGISEYPLLRVSYLNKNNKAKEFPDNLNYTKFDYFGNVNNVCDVVKFLGNKLVLEVTNNELNFKFDSEEYARRYYDFNSEYEPLYLFSGTGTEGATGTGTEKIILNVNGPDLVENPNDETTENPSKINFIHYLFEKFKTQLGDGFKCPPISIIPFNLNKKYRRQDIEDRADSAVNYLGTRPKLSWFNVPTEFNNVMILIEDKDLKEEYGSHGRKPLLYWMMWNIPKNDNLLEEDTYTKVKNTTDKYGNKLYYELYPYRIFNPNTTPQTIQRDILISSDERKKEDFLDSLIDRKLNVKINIFALTDENQEELTQIYEKYSKFNLNTFYDEFFTFKEDLQDGSFTELEDFGEGKRQYYSIKYNLSKEDYLKLNESQSNLNNQNFKDKYKILVAKSSLDNSFDYAINKEVVFNLGHKSYWILKFDFEEESNKTIHIDNNIFIPNKVNNCFYIPHKCSTIQIYSDTWEGKIHYLESTREIYKYEWYDRITTFKNITNLGYGIKNQTSDYKFKAYQCYQEDTNWLVNFGIQNNSGEAKFVLNESLIVDTTNNKFNCLYITEKVKTLEFRAQIPQNCELLNGSIIPVKVHEMKLINLLSREEFIINEEEKYVSPRYITTSTNNQDEETKKYSFKLPLKSNYLVQIKVNGKDSQKTDLIINDEILVSNDETFYNIILKEKDEVKLEININDLREADEIYIYYPKIIEIDTEIQGAQRITTLNHDIFNCKYSNRLPEISWEHVDENYDNIDDDVNNTFTHNGENNLLHGIEVFNAENENEVFYLEWDIKDKKTNCRVFRNTMGDKEEEFIPLNVNSKITEDSLINFIGNKNYLGSAAPTTKFDTLKSGMKKDVYSINDQNCYLGKVTSTSNFTLPPQIKIQTINSDDKKAKLSIFDKSISKNFNLSTEKIEYVSEDFKFIIKYNKKQGKWMLWNKPSMNSNLLVWMAIQEKVGELSSDFEKNWIFSPKFKGETFNFYDYPSQAEENVPIKMEDTKLLKVKMMISSKNLNNGIRCDDYEEIGAVMREGKVDVGYIGKLNQNYGNRFKNSLFRFISKVNLKQSQDKFELYEFTEGDRKKAKLVYTLKIKARIHSYAKKPFLKDAGNIFSKSEDGDNLINAQSESFNITKLVNNQIIKDNTMSYKNYKRILSEQVKRTYINKDIIDAVIPFIKDRATNLVRKNRKSLFEKDRKLLSEDEVTEDIKYRTFMDVEDCLSEILIYRGDLSRVKQRYIPLALRQSYINKTYYSMDETDEKVLKNASSFPVINLNNKIDGYFVKIFREYVNQNRYKVLNNNYVSYGDLELYQNETMLIYRIPVDINCPTFKKHLICEKEDITDSIILSIKQKFTDFLNFFYHINNVLLDINEFLFSPKSNSFLTEQLRDFINDKNNGALVQYQENENAAFFKNSKIIRLRLQIIELSKEIEEYLNNSLPLVNRLDNFIVQYDDNEEFKKKLTTLMKKIKDDLNPKFNELNRAKFELNKINDDLNSLGISLFTKNKIGGEITDAPCMSPSISPSPTCVDIDIPSFKSIDELEKKLLNIFGEQYDDPYLNRSTVRVPSNADNYYKIFKNYNDIDLNSTVAPSPSPEYQEYVFKPMAITENYFQKTFVQLDNFEPDKVVNQSLDKKNKFSTELNNVLSEAIITDLKKIIKDGQETCKLIKQHEQEQIILLSYKAILDSLKENITKFNEEATNSLIENILESYRALKTFKEEFGISPMYSVDDTCGAPSFSITPENSVGPYKQIEDNHPKIFEENNGKDVIKYIEDNISDEQGLERFESLLKDSVLSVLKQYLNKVTNININEAEINTKITNLRDVELEKHKTDFKGKINILNINLDKLRISKFELPEELNFERTNYLYSIISDKENEVDEIKISTESTIKYLRDVKNGIESVSNFDIKVKKIVDYLNLQIDLIPVVNTYSKPFIEVKQKLQKIIDKLKNSNDINIDEKEDTLRKKTVLIEHQNDIQLLDNLLNQIKESSDFIFNNYDDLFPKPKQESVDDITESLGAEPPMFTIEGRSDKQKEDLEKLKKRMNPMDIARVYRDMIYNVFDRD